MWALIVIIAGALLFAASEAALHGRAQQTCTNTEVVVLGAGMAGVAAAKSLVDNGVTDFLLLEYTGVIGGRVAHTNFGKKADGTPYVVELGANWVQGIGSKGGPENPIWTLAKKYRLQNTYSDYNNLTLYNETGLANFSSLLGEYEDKYSTLEQDAGHILTQNLLDRSARSGSDLAGWNPRTNPGAQAVEWFNWDFEYAYSPEQTSQLFGIVNYNTTFYQYSDANNFVFDERGYNQVIRGLASAYLKSDDPRLLLNTIVSNITYNSDSVTIHTRNNTCITAKHAICTFSLGVLQDSILGPSSGQSPADYHAPSNNIITFSPKLPSWKATSVATFQMGIYTKIFLQFPHQFWPNDTQFLLYADPSTRGYYPLWQSLSLPTFLPSSNILFVTVVDAQSRLVESQSDAATLAQVLAVLRRMYPDATVPQPTAFMYPRWGRTPWAKGSYSNWPPGTTVQQHQDLRANVGNLWFAGEATSAEYFGFLHGAYFEGLGVGARVAGCLKNANANLTAERDGSGARNATCRRMKRYSDELHGISPYNATYDVDDGWTVSTFLTYGF